MHLITMRQSTAKDFFKLIKTNTLLEQRIQLMLDNPNTIGFTFKNGGLSEGILEGGYVKLEDWNLSLEETIDVMKTLTEMLEEYEKTPDQIYDGRVLFSDSIMNFEFFLEDEFEDEENPTAETIMFYSSFYIHVIKNEHIKDVTEDDLPF